MANIPEVILIDQLQLPDESNHIILSKPAHFHVHTGNIANWNSLKSRKNQQPMHELYFSLRSTIEKWTKNFSSSEEENKCFAEETYQSPEERALIKITVKVYLHKLDLKFLDEAVTLVLTTLKTDYCDQLILSLPPFEDDKTDFSTHISPYWKKMEELHISGKAKSISSCDLDQDKLQALITVANIKPEVNQVNLTSCCHMPEDLVAYAKEADVVLHTHGDQAVMLPDEKVGEAIRSIDAENQLHWQTNWVLRYAIVIKCRGVIKSKGYIASIKSL